MLQKIKNIFQLEQKIPNGLGVLELPHSVYQGKQPTKSSEFKSIINEVLLPKLKEHGFSGKDFYFFRQNETYTEVIYLWIYKTGGAIQIDLLIKFNNVKYPDDNFEILPNKIRPENAEFQKRLSPNNELNKNGQNVWFWVFAHNKEDNILIVEDIWRVFSIRGLKYFMNFKKHQNYIEKISIKNYLDFPDFFVQRFFGRHEAGIIYFLFIYWRQLKNSKKATEFAKLGVKKLDNSLPIYVNEFESYLKTSSINTQQTSNCRYR